MTEIVKRNIGSRSHHKRKQQKLESASVPGQAYGTTAKVFADNHHPHNASPAQNASTEFIQSKKDNPPLNIQNVERGTTPMEIEASDDWNEDSSSRPPSEGEFDLYDESDEDDIYFCNSNGNSDYDASIFVRSPISAAELEAVAGKVKSALEQPLRNIEKEGYHVYKQHIEQLKVKAEITKKKEDERIQQALSDSKIRGNPREYQTALFEIAKRKNIIINLGTGCGKTLIAVLLIKYFAPSFEDEQQILFMVPSVALAVQHTSTLRANLDYSVETACSTSNCSEKSRRKLASCNIVVATHGAIHDLLTHYGDLFRMQRFSLVVVDECHYAYGRHPYCLVMNDFYHQLPQESRPRVLGLTASPLVNVKEGHSDKHLDETLARLETTLDATVTSIFGLGLEEKEKFNLMLKCADEKDIIYDKYNPICDIPSYEHIGLHYGRIREFKQLDVLLEELGPKVLSIYCRTLAKEVSCNSFEKETPNQFARAVQHLQTIALFADELCRSCPHEGRRDKLLALEELLEHEIEDATNPNTVGLVFVERRITALALSDYFRHRTEQVRAGAWVRAQEIRKSLTSPSKKRARGDDISHLPLEDLGQYYDAAEAVKMDVDEESECQFMDADEPLFDFLPTAALPTAHNSFTMSATGSGNDYGPTFDDNQQKNVGKPIWFDSLSPDGYLPTHFNLFAGCDVSDCEDYATCMVDSIRCGVLVRNSTNIFKSLNSSQSLKKIEQVEARKTWLHQETKIRETLNRLRRKEINVLIATSVVEEGVDVQACSFVAVFDPIKSTKAYIQMKGRARREDAKFFVFQARDHFGKGYISLSVAQDMEQRVHKFLATRVPVLQQPVEQKNDYFGRSLSWELQALESRAFATEHGRVDLNTAKSLVNRYALSVPMDPFARSSKEILLAHLPVYEDCQLSLPSHLPRDMRVVTLPERYRNIASKKQKESLLALMACARLYSKGLLNDRLLPLTKEDMRERVLQVANQELPETPIFRLKPKDPSEVFIYIIQQSSPSFDLCDNILNGKGRRLVLVTTNPLSIDIPSIGLRHRQFGKINVELTAGDKIVLNDNERKTLVEFFILLINTRWRRKTQDFFFRVRQDDEMGVIDPYYIGLATANNVLDWGYMTQLLRESKRKLEERIDAVRSQSELPSPRLWSPLFDRNMLYVSYGPSGETCDEQFPFKKEGIKTYKDYFKVVRGFDVEPTSPLFEAQRGWHLPVKLTRLNCSSESAVNTPTRTNHRRSRYSLCEELVTVRLPRDACFEPPLADPYIYLCCTMLPQVMYIVERHIAAKAFVDHCISSLPTLGICLRKLPLEKVQEALSSKGCCLDVSFDKLEWLGDAVLKLVQVSLFALRPLGWCCSQNDTRTIRTFELSRPILYSTLSISTNGSLSCTRVTFRCCAQVRDN
jgi:ERCC4-related helicase